MKNRLISAIFIIMIFVWGGATAFRASSDVLGLARSGELDSGTPGEVESILQENMFSRILWIDIHGLTQRLLGRSVVEEPGSDVYRLSDGSITGGCARKSGMKLRGYASAVRKVRDRIPADTELLYVQLPFKVGSNSQLPPGIRSYANSNCSRLLKALKKEGIETLDVRSCILEEGLDWETLFYKTDHHWRPQTALWTAGRICEYLEEEHGYSFEPSLYSMDNMKVETFPDLFLGSLGRRTGSLYAGTDDFELVTPAYPTDFDFISYPGDEVIHREGDFREALIDDGNLRKDWYNINNYAAYTGDSTKTTTTINRGEPLNDRKILLVRDSYSCALQPFLSLSQKQITTIDLRYFRDESVIDHINANAYDLVIIAYTPSAFDSTRFTFDKIKE